MITNMIVAVVVSIVTNWTPVYEQVPFGNLVPCTTYESCVAGNDTKFQTGLSYPIWTVPVQPKGKYLGEDGVAVEVTELRFEYLGQPCVHRIEKPLKKIQKRCHEKQPEVIWDAPVEVPL